MRQRARYLEVQHKELVDLAAPLLLRGLYERLACELAYIVIVNTEERSSWLGNLDRNHRNCSFFVDGRELRADAFVHLELDSQIYVLIRQLLRIAQRRLGIVEILHLD